MLRSSCRGRAWSQGPHHAVQKSTRTGEETWAPCWSKFSKLILNTAIRRCVETCLTNREAKVITLRYGLDGEVPRPQGELASACGISRSYVSELR